MYPNHRENIFLEMVWFSYTLFTVLWIQDIYCYQVKLLGVMGGKKTDYTFNYKGSMCRDVSSVQKSVESPGACELLTICFTPAKLWSVSVQKYCMRMW